jgi:hypothetical protein
MSLQDFYAAYEQVRIIASLQQSERPYVAEGVVQSKYLSPKDSYFPMGKYMVQAVQRGRSGQSTDKDAETIQALADSILTLAKEEGVSRYDFYMNFHPRFDLYKQLHGSLNEALSTGLKNWEETATTASANFMDVTEAKKSLNKTRVAQTIEKVGSACHAILKRKELYQRIEEKSLGLESPPISRKAHLTDLLTMFFNPQASFEAVQMDISRQVLPAKAVIEILVLSFGDRFVNDVIDMYGLQNEIFFSYQDFQALLIGLVANVTQKDVEDILNNKNSVLYTMLQSKLGINQAASIQIDSEKKLAQFLEAIRNVDVGGACCSEGKGYADQLRGDLAFLASCKNVSKYNYIDSQWALTSHVQALKQFGYTEHLARDYAYTFFDSERHHFRNGVLFPQYDTNGSLVCREGHLLVNKDAVMAFAAMPVEGLSAEQDRIQVVFRGTYDYNSMKRDISPGEKGTGPGKVTFERHVGELYDHLHALITAKINSPFTLEVTGHSLGACDTMRLTAYMAEQMVAHPNDPALLKIKGVNAFTYNAPAVEVDVSTKFIDNVVKADMPFKIRTFVSYGDIVSTFGSHFLGYLHDGQVKPEKLNLTWIEFMQVTKANQTDCLRDVYADGCVTAVKKSAIERAYPAHSLPYFAELEEDLVRVRCFSTTDEAEASLFHVLDSTSAIPQADMNLVLTPKFNYRAYMQAKELASV